MALLLLWSSRLQRCLWTSPILAVLFSSYPGLAATSSLAHTQKAGIGRDLLTRYMRLCVRSGSTLHTYKMTEWGDYLLTAATTAAVAAAATATSPLSCPDPPSNNNIGP